MYLSSILDTKGSMVVTTAPHRTLGEVVGILGQKGIGAVVVTGGDGAVLGIVSERDVIRVLARDGEGVLQDAVSRHMTAKVVTATADMLIDDAMARMTAGRFRHLPIVAEGRLAGLISMGDVVKHRLEAVEQEKQSMLDYIGTA